MTIGGSVPRRTKFQGTNIDKVIKSAHAHLTQTKAISESLTITLNKTIFREKIFKDFNKNII